MTPDALRNWRARLGLSQTGAADALGISVRTLQDWEQGRCAPLFPNVLALACAAVARKVKPWPAE